MPREETRAPLYSAGEEVAHALSHGAGLALSVAGLVVLVVAASLRGDAWHVVGCAVFGLTLVLLYGASTLYHGVRHPRAKARLRQLDHAAIFVLVAGTYTPFTLVSLRGSWGWTLLAVAWGMALLGVVFHAAAPSRAQRLSAPILLAMGWLGVVAVEPLLRALHPEGVLLLLAGGLAYSLGVVFYAWQRPYHHAIWHLFVLGGSLCHYSCVLGYVIPPA